MKTIHIVYIVFLTALSLWLSTANAQGLSLLKPSNVVGPYSAYFPAGQTGFSIASGSTAAVGNGVSVTTSGVAVAVKNGSYINIPVSLTTLIPKGNTALIALRAFKVARALAGPVGLALTAFDIYNVVKDSGLAVCPPPDFFCTPATEVSVPVIHEGYRLSSSFTIYASPADACNAYFASMDASTKAYFVSFVPVRYTDGSMSCVSSKNGQQVTGVQATPNICPDGTSTNLEFCTVRIPAGPASDAVIEAKVTQSINNDATNLSAKRAWDAAQSLNEIARANGKEGVPIDVMMPPTAQTTMNAPPVSTPEVTTSTEQFTDAHGVPQTRTSKESTTITPVQSGNGTATNVTYNVQNTTTTTVTNNTGQSTSNPPSTTTTTDHSTLETSPTNAPAADFPTDYNREPTQQAIAADIKAMRNECQDNPHRVGCAELDAPPVADLIPRKNVPITFTPLSFASSANCPAPITFDMYGPRQITFTPMCDLMTRLRPLFLACAAAGATIIFMRGLKS